MDLTTLGPTIQRLLQAGLAKSTQRVYAAGKNKFLAFCQETNITPFPVTEQKLISFVAYGVNKGLKYQTIKCYLSAVRHLQVMCGGGDPRVESMPLLELALRGTRKEQSGSPKRTRLPITPAILEKIRQIWNRDAADWDHVMLWAACCVGFFGFLRSGELTAPETDDFDPGQHLTFADIAVDDQFNPRTVSIRIIQSKTDPFRQGVTIYLGRTESALCPVAALLAYLALHGKGHGPLFRFKDGRPLTRPRLVTAIRTALEAAGFNPGDFAGHSFRIGAATTAAACGVPVDVIKTLGRWKSQAYQLYVRLPKSQLAAISQKLVTAKI